MKLTKDQIGNLAWIVLLVLILFTPVGFHLKVWTNTLFSFTPNDIAEHDRETLKNYRWALQNLEGKPFSFESVKGKVVFVNYWATWCPPCVAELPNQEELYKVYGDSVAFLFVARDDKDKVMAFLDKKGYTLPVYFAKTKPPELLATNSLPTTFILSKTGAIAIHKKGSADWDNPKVKSLLDVLLKE